MEMHCSGQNYEQKNNDKIYFHSKRQNVKITSYILKTGNDVLINKIFWIELEMK